MTASRRVFVSSVQKELEDERLIVQNLVNTDPFLAAHCVPVLYELEPASPEKALDGCLRSSIGTPATPCASWGSIGSAWTSIRWKPCARGW